MLLKLPIFLDGIFFVLNYFIFLSFFLSFFQFVFSSSLFFEMAAMPIPLIVVFHATKLKVGLETIWVLLLWGCLIYQRFKNRTFCFTDELLTADIFEFL